MNAFNRFVIVLLLLALAAAAATVLMVGLGWVRPEQLAVGFWLQEGLGILARPDRPEHLPGLIIALLTLLGAILLASLELRTLQRIESPIVVKQGPLGRVTVARAGIRELADSEASRVPGVMQAHTRIRGEDRLRVSCRVSVDPAAELSTLSAEVQARVKSAIEHHVGRPVGEVRVHTQLDPLTGGRSASRVR